MFSIFLLSCVLSADPVVVIDAPDTVHVFTPVRYDFSKSTPGWYEFSITPTPPYTERANGAKSGVFLGPPGRYTLSLNLIVPPSKPDGELTRVKGERVVEIVSAPPPLPPLPPGPNPPAPPSPDVPPGKYGLAKVALDAVALLPVSAKAKSPAVSASCQQIAKDLRSGELKVNLSTVSTIQSRLIESFGDQKIAWGAWMTTIRKSLEQLAKSKTLPSTAIAVSEAIDEIAVGLALVR